MSDPVDREALVNALRSGRQADMDGIFVVVSRQAVEEAADLIAAGMVNRPEAVVRDEALRDAADVAHTIDADKFNATYRTDFNRKRYDQDGVKRATNRALNIQAEDARDAILALRTTPSETAGDKVEALASAAAAYEKAAQRALAPLLPSSVGGDLICDPHQAECTAAAIRALATEAETTALAEMLDAETRECAELMQPMLRSMLSRGEAYRIILARIDQRKEEGV